MTSLIQNHVKKCITFFSLILKCQNSRDNNYLLFIDHRNFPLV